MADSFAADSFAPDKPVDSFTPDKGGFTGPGADLANRFHKFDKDVASGAWDVVSGLPQTAISLAKGALPTPTAPWPAGKIGEDITNQVQEAYHLAQHGMWSEAAKKIPVVGGMYDYATTHNLPQDIGALGATAGLGLLTDGVAKFRGGPPPIPATFMGATPEVRTAISVLKPSNAIKAVEEYPQAITRLKTEHPELGESTQDFPKQLMESFNNSLAENRHYYEGHVGPLKTLNMQVPLDKMADAITDSISPKLRLEDPGGVKALEDLADKYRTKTSLPDLENMLQETNAQVRAMNAMNTGEKSQALRASETKTILDRQAKTFRDIFYKAVDSFNVPDVVKNIQREYGRILGMKLDAEQLINSELTKPPEVTGKLAGVGKAATAGAGAGLVAGHGLEGAVLGGITGGAGRFVANVLKKGVAESPLDTLQKVFKDWKVQAQPYPTPPIQAPASRLALPAPTTKLPGIAAPPAGPQPSGPIPPGMGPSAVYPSAQPTALPPATTRFHPGETYGPGGTGPVVSSEQLAGPPPPPPTVNLIKVARAGGGTEYITQDELYRRLQAQKGRK